MSLTKSAFLGSTLFFIAHLTALPALALKFESGFKDGRSVLYIRDCSSQQETCKPWEEDFTDTLVNDKEQKIYDGDAEVLNDLLTQKERSGKPYNEVWFFSGGGSLNAGIKIAKVLREHQATVRVLKGQYCVSACTVAFMGGHYRHIDDGASYRVHSASSVMSGSTGDHWLAEKIADAKRDPDHTLITFAKDQQIDARTLARTLERLFQNSLLDFYRIHLPDNDKVFEEWANDNPPSLDYTDPGNPQRLADLKRYKKEGPACLQDIFMRIERDSMTHAIEDVRAILPSLGKRADLALNMVSAMYMTSIKETSELSRETMLQMGYITDDAPVQ